MTTTVRVEAHCGENTEVQVVISDHEADEDEPETFRISNGETAERYVYDGREIRVMEVPKD